MLLYVLYACIENSLTNSNSSLFYSSSNKYTYIYNVSKTNRFLQNYILSFNIIATNTTLIENKRYIESSFFHCTSLFLSSFLRHISVHFDCLIIACYYSQLCYILLRARVEVYNLQVKIGTKFKFKKTKRVPLAASSKCSFE